MVRKEVVIDFKGLALFALVPNAKFTWDESLTDELFYEGLSWAIENDSPKPAELELKNKLAELQAAYDAQAYARLRKTEYDKLNQNEMMYDDEINSTTTWKDAIAAIKTKYPKPE
jgi:hypothetical protein